MRWCVVSNRSSLTISFQVVVTVALFLFAIRLLGSAVETLSPVLRRVLEQVVVGDRSALGISWFASYVLANGSVVAALSVSLFSSDLIVRSQLFLMVVGSRLGGAAVVIFIGAFDYLNEELDTLSDSVSLGLLTFLLTHSIYLPVLVVGYVTLPLIEETGLVGKTGLGSAIDTGGTEAIDMVAAGQGVPGIQTHIPDLPSLFSGWIIQSFGGGVAFLLAIGLIFSSMRLFDRTLDKIDKQRLRRRYLVKLNNKWTSFGLGLVFTGLTTSVAFSLGVIVPLYNRGHIKRNEIIPYVLGANIGTLVDTLIVAVALNTPVGVATVALLLAISFVVSMIPMAFYSKYTRIIDSTQSELVNDLFYFIGFLVTLLIVPILLIVL